MALKGVLWFFGKCLDQERSRSNLSYLASKVLDLGVKGRDKTRGHVLQAWGGAQQFFIAYPYHRATIQAASPFQGYAPTAEILEDWLKFLSEQPASQYGRRSFGYSWNTLRGYLTPKYGGSRQGGGGGDNEFEIVLRLAASMA